MYLYIVFIYCIYIFVLISRIWIEFQFFPLNLIIPIYCKCNVVTYEHLPVRSHEVYVGYEPLLRVSYRRYVDSVAGEYCTVELVIVPGVLLHHVGGSGTRPDTPRVGRP